MKQELLFAPVGTKTYVMPKTKYIIIYTTNPMAQRSLRRMERGRIREGRNETIARPELYPFKTGKRSAVFLEFNKFTLTFVARLLKKYPDEVMLFVGENYWFSELPKEIQKFSDYGGTNTQLLGRIEREEAITACSNGIIDDNPNNN